MQIVIFDSGGQLGTVSSSKKYKENIKDIISSEKNEDNFVNKIKAMRPVLFNYKTQPGTTSAGLIAEELFEIFPELVVLKNNQPETIQYNQLFGYLIKSLQICFNKIDELSTR